MLPPKLISVSFLIYCFVLAQKWGTRIAMGQSRVLFQRNGSERRLSMLIRGITILGRCYTIYGLMRFDNLIAETHVSVVGP